MVAKTEKQKTSATQTLPLIAIAASAQAVRPPRQAVAVAASASAAVVRQPLVEAGAAEGVQTGVVVVGVDVVGVVVDDVEVVLRKGGGDDFVCIDRSPPTYLSRLSTALLVLALTLLPSRSLSLPSAGPASADATPLAVANMAAPATPRGRVSCRTSRSAAS